MASDVTVTPDQVSIGVLVSSVPRDVIDAAVAARGVGVKRSGGSLSRFGCWDASWRVPTSSGITQARKRVGSPVLADVFEGVAQPVATMSTRGAWLRRWRLLAIDGFDADLSDSDANVAEFGYAGSGDNRSAFPKARVVALAECGTHAFVAAEVDAWSVGEKTLAAKLYPRLRRDELLNADRNFYSFDAWSVAVRTGAALLWRAPTQLRLPVVAVLADGTYSSVVINPAIRGARRDRIVEAARAGGDLDPADARSDELAAAYHDRWEEETANDQLKTHLRGPGRVLRSRLPDLVRQEIWAWLSVHYAVAVLVARAPEAADLDPDRISFTRTLRLVRRTATGTAAFPP